MRLNDPAGEHTWFDTAAKSGSFPAGGILVREQIEAPASNRAAEDED